MCSISRVLYVTLEILNLTLLLPLKALFFVNFFYPSLYTVTAFELQKDPHMVQTVDSHEKCQVVNFILLFSFFSVQSLSGVFVYQRCTTITIKWVLLKVSPKKEVNDIFQVRFNKLNICLYSVKSNNFDTFFSHGK